MAQARRRRSVSPDGRPARLRLRSIASLLGLVAALALPAVAEAAPGWSSAGDMAAARQDFAAALLPHGDVLAAGGYTTATGALASAELFHPSTNNWSVAHRMGRDRQFDTATLLPSGKVLVVGIDSGTGTAAELYDPASDTWSSAGAMITPRRNHTATLLANGKVLVAGGFSGSGGLASAELYDPTTNSWSAAAPMSVARIGHTATLLPDGKVLVAGGDNGESRPFLQIWSTAEVYDPATNSWSSAGSMPDAREDHAATLLPTGKVLVAGGENESSNLTRAALYNPATNTWSPAASMSTARVSGTATRLLNGRVLVTGGLGGPGGYNRSAELYDAFANRWSSAGLMASARASHAATLLRTGQVLVAGGYNQTGQLKSSELYTPTSPILSFAASHTRFRIGRAATVVSARTPAGTRFLYRLSTPAIVRIRILEREPGRVSGGVCRPPTRALARRRACVRLIERGVLIRRASRGLNSTAFSGRIASRVLPRGSYKAVATATVPGLPAISPPRAIRFTIVAR